ncbi:MAG: mechanosensitive ion channel family protein [Bacteroidota bacterium]
MAFDILAPMICIAQIDDVSALQEYSSVAINWILRTAPKVVGAAVVLLVGFWLLKRIIRLFEQILERAKLGPELAGFFLSLASIALKFIVVLVAAGIMGFQVSSLLGVLAGVVFAVGLALQGFLGNFASGITIVFFKPYKVEDWVQIADSFGRVQSMEIFNTILVTPGDKTLIIPNGQVTSGIITNFSSKGKIRLELQVTMPYEESFDKVRAIIHSALSGVPSILPDPKPMVGIESFDSHNLIVSVRPYIYPDDYWDATFDCLSSIKKAFSDAGIKVAYSEGVELGPIGD